MEPPANLYSDAVLHPVFSQLIEYGVPWRVVNDIKEEFENLAEVYRPQLLSDIARYSMEGFVLGNLDFVFAIPARLKKFNLEHEKKVKEYKLKNAATAKAHYHANKGKFKCCLCPRLKCCARASQFAKHCNRTSHLKKANLLLTALPADIQKLIGEFSKS